MRWQRTLSRTLVLVGVPLGILLVVLVIIQYRPVGGENVLGVKANHVGRALMLDPQGDAEMARRILASAEANGTAQVVLSRKVLGGELPCLGFEGFPGLESRPADTFGLVVLEGQVRHTFRYASLFPPPYHAFLYDVRYPGLTAEAGPQWSRLRAAFGGPGWPQDSPMYLSPDGQPGLAELDPHLLAPGYPAGKSQDMRVSQEIGGWTVTVAQVYAGNGGFSVIYTVTGPHSRFKADGPWLLVEGTDLPEVSSTKLEETIGPSVGLASFGDLPQVEQPQDITLHFLVPAIHVRPARSPCEVPGTNPAYYPTPTPLPTRIWPVVSLATPIPDVQTVGPFRLEVKVHVTPAPTEPPVPTPVPTPESALPPLPQPTGRP